METILIVDDEADIREILSFNLEAAGYMVVNASTAEQAHSLIKSGNVPSLILLDVMLPGISGFKLADILRKEENLSIPIIFLTARNTENDLLTGFSAGGDDYISKPFSINEVLVRIKAVLKRVSASVENNNSMILECGPLRIDVKDKKVYVDGELVEFSRKEFDILTLLITNRGKVYSRTDFIAELWKDAPYIIDRTVDVHIARIRSKLGIHRDLIQNKVGFGYSISNE